MTRYPIALAGLTLCLLGPLAGMAAAHAERSSEQPKEDATVEAPPAEITVGFTEPPTGDASASVTDGCGNELVSAVAAGNQTLTVSLAEGQPGKWQVATTVVSAVDGHRTKDSYSFTVAGDPDCNAAAPELPSDDEVPDTGGSSLPWIPITIGIVAMLGIAMLVRGRD